ncbi:MAG: AMP-binding protein [Sphingomonadales bacterium]
MPIESAPLATLADVEAIETVPLSDRFSFRSTYELLADAARKYSDRTALIFLPTGGVDDQAQEISYRKLLARITQAANMFTDLGLGPGDVVSYLLPNLPQTHYTIWGGEAAGLRDRPRISGRCRCSGYGRRNERYDGDDHGQGCEDGPAPGGRESHSGRAGRLQRGF